MRVSGPVCGPSKEWRRAIVCALLLVCFSPNRARSQDLAEAAKQEKARKAEQQQNQPHVYTEEDLKRKSILTPEDQAKVEARKRQQNAAGGEQNAKQAPANVNLEDESLGEIARRYRQEKAEHEAELSERKKFAPFPYAISDGSLAVPNPSVAPIAVPGASTKTLILSAPTAPKPTAHLPFPIARGRISPFQPRPLTRTPLAGPQENLNPEVLPRTSVAPLTAGVSANSVEKSALSTPSIQGMKKVEVQRGQSWWKLAEMYLGDGARWRELRALNTDAAGRKELLLQGSTVLVPDNMSLTNRASKRTIEVQKGDSLWSLSAQYFGRGTAWGCLAAANPQVVDYTHLEIGTKLQLPEGDDLKSCGVIGKANN
jgi:nucleoid-associated protein YgaU